MDQLWDRRVAVVWPLRNRRVRNRRVRNRRVTVTSPQTHRVEIEQLALVLQVLHDRLLLEQHAYPHVLLLERVRFHGKVGAHLVERRLRNSQVTAR